MCCLPKHEEKDSIFFNVATLYSGSLTIYLIISQKFVQFFYGPLLASAQFSCFGEESWHTVLTIQFSSVYILFEVELHSCDYLLSQVFAAMWEIRRGRFQRFQSNHPKTIENMFYFILPWSGPFSPESSSLPSQPHAS